MSAEPVPDGGEPAAIVGLRLLPLSAQRDARGSFLEVFKDSWELPVRPAQWSLVHSSARTLRGLYLHLRHDELFLLVQGSAHVGLKDLRRGSPTFGQAVLLAVNAESPIVVVFPPGVLHGWYFSEAAVHLQAVSEEYDRYRDDDNFSCHWADPELGLPWPDPAPLLSPDAEHFGSLRTLLARLPGSPRSTA